MEDKRRRARVQGAWAGPVKSQATAQPATTAKSHLHQRPGQTWMNKEHHLVDRQFVFKEPQQVVRRAPEPRVIDKEGVYEISVSPTGVSRVCLYPGFIDLKEADWVLQQLCEVVPWKQRTGIRDDVTYKQPRLTAWYGELPYTYSRITMEPNPHVCWNIVVGMEENGDYTYVERVKIPLDHGTLLIMEGATQADWQHRVPKEYHSREPRINLTFRTVYPDPGGAHW
ncbi:alpha-ketoglutarate-dependent dioxygenase alkB homolog 3 [Mirounga leonina]|uniref:alpha-ketoglutarate-dependent dioxygenase alkB homolog 3 n=1 Tax=Mirounga leonina TaxID=9715 RepID=UPI00156C142F|nr:alpha-ketoglutarate-dependent dioxygenase alkB homolog 3 [Mirounga leonina]